MRQDLLVAIVRVGFGWATVRFAYLLCLALAWVVVQSLALADLAWCKPSATDKLQLGELMFFNGNIDGAIRAFRRAIELNPKLWEAHMDLVNMYIQKSDLAAAIQECQEVLKLKPDHKEILLILGNLQRTQNDLEGAETSLKKAVDLGASPPMAHNALGLCLLQKGDTKAAHEHLDEAIKRQHKFPEAHLTLGVVLFKEGDKAGALKEFDEAIKEKGLYPEAHNAEGDILSADSQWQKAVEEYKKAVKEEPKYAQAYASMGNAYMQLGDLPAAREAYAKAKEINPNDKNIVYGLALMLEKSGRTDEALSEFQTGLLLETDPTMAAQIRLHMNQLKDASAFQLNTGGIGPGAYASSGADLLKDATLGNPFGQSFADLIKIKPPPGASKSK